MTEPNHFVEAILPEIERQANVQFAHSEECDDLVADRVALAWETYASLSQHMAQPEFRHVLGTMAARSVKCDDAITTSAVQFTDLMAAHALWGLQVPNIIAD